LFIDGGLRRFWFGVIALWQSENLAVFGRRAAERSESSNGRLPGAIAP